MKSPDVATIDDTSFEAAVGSGVSAVKFSAEWCGPCHILAPTVESLAAELTPRVRFFDLDADANPVTMAKFGVRGLPTILLFHDGKAVDAIVGAVPKDRLRARIDALIAQVETGAA